ncbi:MAG: flagellar hook capping protein [Rhodospirillales bacterium CG15_BIG_FIL_POST_REV_8_21_14_020_66_15]|nr:MAG: flagellar hook capping protein [Rhodospirillales bacterium CG15_BIG_FIL_POST_REV_8_21_14_020_66_15]
MSIINGISSTVNTDPNSKSAQNAQSLEEDLNRFLTLLTTQLQHQDPLDPMDATEFTSQLVQFASVEQQIFQNSNLEKLLAVQETNKLSSLVGFIDNVVEVEGQDLVLDQGSSRFTYSIPIGAVQTKITITDAAGLQVFTADGQTQPGIHSVEWDGTDKNGQQQPDGLYRVQVTTFDRQNNLLDVLHTTFGRVTGGGVVDGKTTLFMGPLRVDQDSVLSVQKPESTPTSSDGGTGTVPVPEPTA